jgi:hypothetical protein
MQQQIPLPYRRHKQKSHHGNMSHAQSHKYRTACCYFIFTFDLSYLHQHTYIILGTFVTASACFYIMKVTMIYLGVLECHGSGPFPISLEDAVTPKANVASG